MLPPMILGELVGEISWTKALLGRRGRGIGSFIVESVGECVAARA
jgi:hypothetical protein